MNDQELKAAQNLKRNMVDRFITLRAELNTFSRNDLLLIRTSQLEEFGKLLRDCVDYGKDLKT